MEESILIPYRKKDKWGYSDPDKNIVIPCQYDWAPPFTEERAVVLLDNLYGFQALGNQGQPVCLV
jgi:hypothetical protein